MFTYYVMTVGRRIPLTGHRTVKGSSAAEVCAEIFGTGAYRRVDVAPAVPVNGYPEGLVVRHGDVAFQEVAETTPAHLLPEACFVCGYGPQAADHPGHTYWSNADAASELAAEEALGIGVSDPAVGEAERVWGAGMSATHSTREAWLVAAVEALAPLFAEVSETYEHRFESLPVVRVSVGWPGGRGKKSNVIGQCWASVQAADGVAQLFISPVVVDPVVILATLAHELVHAVDDCESGHRGRFIKVAKAIGLTPKWTATGASDELAARLTEIAGDLGEYPHAALSPSARGKTQSTRMLKVECLRGSGYIVRMTRKWLDEVGAPLCPCHEAPMEVAA